MKYTGIQPQYFPRLHYFARILQTDIFCIRDDAQFVAKHKYPDGSTGKSYQAHSPIKQSNGILLIRVPIVHNGLLPISKTKIQYESDWVENHLKAIANSYGKSPYFKKIFPSIKSLLIKRYNSLSDLNCQTIFWAISILLGKEISPGNISSVKIEKLIKNHKSVRLKKIRYGSKSESIKNENLSASEKIIALCKEHGANEDYCGETGLKAYIDLDNFKKNGISINVQKWQCKKYYQLYTKQIGFIKNLSIIDLLMNVSSDEALSILLNK